MGGGFQLLVGVLLGVSNYFVGREGLALDLVLKETLLLHLVHLCCAASLFFESFLGYYGTVPLDHFLVLGLLVEAAAGLDEQSCLVLQVVVVPRLFFDGLPHNLFLSNVPLPRHSLEPSHAPQLVVLDFRHERTVPHQVHPLHFAG